MRFVIFCHSLLSDWNHGNAHFLRGVATELVARGHEVLAQEPADAWSVRNLVAEEGEGALERFRAAYPSLRSARYDLASLDLDAVLDGADVVIVHEWNEPALVRRVGEHRRGHSGYVLLFHDTHHRAATDPAAMAALGLERYDGVLAFGAAVRDIYLARGWARRAFVWHEAADVRVFRPHPEIAPEADLVWIGNWGDEERTGELHRFLLGPIRDLRLRARLYGVRYPAPARAALAEAGAEYAGWIPNFEAPRALAAARLTVHVPRRPYVEALPGIPTIRPFEAMACGLPLVCSEWHDSEGLFSPGEDHLVARDGAEMRRHLRAILSDPGLAEALSRRALATILRRHTCAHRVDELLAIRAGIAGAARPAGDPGGGR